jgi:adhesin/invasin
MAGIVKEQVFMHRFIIVLMGLMIALGIGGCGDGHDTDTSGNDTISVAADKTELSRGQSCIITAIVKNAGKEVAGREVTFGFVSNVTGATFTITKANTNAAGEAKALYMAGTNAGSDIVRASISNGAMMDVNIVVDVGGFSITVTADPNSLAAGEMSTIAAIVKNAKGTAVSGVMVNFDFLTNNSGATLRPLWKGLTDASGQATAIYTAGGNDSDTTVQDSIMANLGSNSGVEIITRTVGTAMTVSLSANPNGFAGGWTGYTVQSILTATITGGSGSSVSGINITFSIETGGGSLDTYTAVTNAKGEAVVRYTRSVTEAAGTKFLIVFKATLPDGTYNMITMEIDA